MDVRHVKEYCTLSPEQVKLCRVHRRVRMVQYSTVQHGTRHHGIAQRFIVQYSTAQNSAVEYSIAHHSTVQHSTVQYSTVQYSTVQYSTVQYSTVQYSTVQHVPFKGTPEARSLICHILFRKLVGIKIIAESNERGDKVRDKYQGGSRGDVAV